MKRGILAQALSLAVLAAGLASDGCSLFRTLAPSPPPLQEDFSTLRPEDFPAKIRQLEDLAEHDPSASVRTRALFYVALAHLHYRNPAPDYPKAVQYLEKHIALETARRDIDEVVALKSIVQLLEVALQEREKLARDYAQLKQQYDRTNKNGDSLAKTIESQKKQIESLKQTIKELDTVQQEIEKKRRGIRK